MRRLLGIVIVLVSVGGCASSPFTDRPKHVCHTHGVGNQSLTECSEVP